MMKFNGIRAATLSILAISLILLSCQLLQAAVLEDFRLGVSPKRTRIVYQLDEAPTYEIEYNQTSVTIRFENLAISDQMKEKVARFSGGLLKKGNYVSINDRVVFELNVTEPFMLRYFDLAKPERLVVDLYPRETAAVTPPPAAKEESTPAKEPVAVQETPPVKEETPSEGSAATGTEEIAQETGAETESQLAEDPAAHAEEPPPLDDTFGDEAAGSHQGLSWMFIIIPIAIVLLLVVGFIALRRASHREEFHDEEEEEGTDWDYDGAKFQKLYQADQTSTDEPQEPPEGPAVPPTEEDVIEDESEVPPVSMDIPDYKSEIEEVKKEIDFEAPVEEEEVAEEAPASELEETQPEKTEEEKPAAIEEEEELMEDLAHIPDIPQASRRTMHRIVDEGEAELNFEEGYLIWPVHILETDRPGKILVVDDEAEIVNALEEFLTREKYDVAALTSSREAVQKYLEWHPDLVITDVVMPELSGVEMIQQIDEQNGGISKVIFLSGRSERDDVSKTFQEELDDGRFEFFRKPLSLVQISGRIRDYFNTAQQILHLEMRDREGFIKQIEPLVPNQLVTLQKFLWDRIFEIAAEMLGRRIEPYYITDRMEPPVNYMRRVGCQEREDYCIANICFGSNPTCAAQKLRGEIEIMRQIINEFREEYTGRVSRSIGEEDLGTPKPRKKAAAKKKTQSDSDETEGTPPPRKTLRRLDTPRKR